MGARRDGRIAAVQILYQIDLQQLSSATEPKSWVERHFAHLSPQSETEVRAFAARLCRQVCEQCERIDAMIAKASANWRLSRMDQVDRNVLRVAVCELLTDSTVPARIVINEAVEIGKLLGESHSSAFINGVLEGVCAQLDGRGAARGCP